VTFAELQTDFYASGFAYLDDNGTGAVRAKRWLNQSYLEICALEPWPFLETTTTGVAPLVISNLRQVVTVLDTTNKVNLEHSDFASLAQLYPNQAVTGTTLYWYVASGTTVTLLPANASLALSVRYLKVPTELSNAADSPLLPAAYHDIIVLGAWRRGLLDDSNAGDYALIKTEWAERLGAMRQALLDNPTSQYLTFAGEDW
jgi:hypothetical protein